jgi:hypothetical protein
MKTRTSKISSAELATEASSFLVGLGILSLALFPFVLPGLLLGLVLALPLVIPAVPVLLIWLLARGVVRALRSLRRMSHRQETEAAREPRQVTVWTGSS